MKQVVGWLWMGGAIAVLIAIQAFRQSGPLAWVDNALNGARVLVPATIAITIVGAGLLLGAAIHGGDDRSRRETHLACADMTN